MFYRGIGVKGVQKCQAQTMMFCESEHVSANELQSAAEEKKEYGRTLTRDLYRFISLYSIIAAFKQSISCKVTLLFVRVIR